MLWENIVLGRNLTASIGTVVGGSSPLALICGAHAAGLDAVDEHVGLVGVALAALRPRWAEVVVVYALCRGHRHVLCVLCLCQWTIPPLMQRVTKQLLSHVSMSQIHVKLVSVLSFWWNLFPAEQFVRLRDCLHLVYTVPIQLPCSCVYIHNCKMAW